MMKTDPMKRSRLMYIIQAALEHLIAVLVSGSFLATLTTELGMSDSLTGILSSFISLGCLFQMLSIFFRKGSDKRFTLVISLVNQVLFLLLFVIPVWEGGENLKIGLFIGVILLAYVALNFGVPRKTAWLMSLVEEGNRGRFTAKKEIVSLLVGMLFSFLMGLLVDSCREAGNLRLGFILCAVTIFVLMVVHTLTLLLTVERPKVKAEEPRKGQLSGMFSVFRNKNVLKVAGVFVLWNIANYVTTPFFGTYQIKELGFSLTTVSLITIISSLARVAVSNFWGGYADRHSFAKMVRWCFVVAAVGFSAVIFATPENGLVMFSLYSICHAVSMGGINSSVINLCYDYAPASMRADAMALTQAAAGLTGFLATLATSPLVSLIQENGNTVFGLPIYAQQLVSIVAVLVIAGIVLYVSRVLLKATPVGREEEKA